MAAYGYRLFTIEAFLRRSRTKGDLTDLSDLGVGTDGATELVRHLTDNKDSLLVGAANYRRVGDFEDEGDDLVRASRKHPYLVVRDVQREGNRVEVQVEYGREGDYEILLSSDGSETIEMKGRAAARRYRVWFIFPERQTEGKTGFVISETRGRTHAATALVHWLRVQNQRAVSRVTDGNLQEGDWVRWHTVEAFDPHRLDDVLSESSSHQITLRRKTVDAAGDRRGGALKLTQQGIPVSKVRDLKAIIQNWWETRNDRSLERRRSAARDLGVLLGMSDEASTLGFNDGEISFQEMNKTQTISPNTIERLYVYPLGERPQSKNEILTAAFETLRGIAPALDVEVDLTL